MGNIYEIQKSIINKMDDKINYELENELNELTEESFYPPADTRILHSLIEDIGEGNNYLEYAEYIYDLYEEEGFYEN